MRKVILFTLFLITLLSTGHIFGEAWQDVTGGLTDGEFYSIAEAPGRDGGIIYIGTREGLYKKQDGDEDWKRIFICRGQNRGVNHIYVTRDNTIYIATKSGLYESGNSGKTWKQLFRGMGKENYSTYVTLGRENGGTIYLGTLKGLFRTQNKGNTWKKSPGMPGKTRINSIVPTEIAGEKYLFVICDNEIYKITEDFKSYKKVFGSDSFFRNLENNSDNIDDIIESANGAEDSPIFLLNDITAKKDILYVATNRGLFISMDNGESWSRFNDAGLSERHINSILVTDVNSPKASEKIFAATKGGVFEYDEKESVWNKIYRGMTSLDARKLMLSKNGTLWVLCKSEAYKREFEGADTKDKWPDDADRILSKFDGDPTINETIDMAIEYAEVYPDKIEKWRKLASYKALFPKVNFGIDQGQSDTYEIYTSSTTSYWTYGPEDKTEGWDLNFSWDLSDLVWNPSQTTIDIRSKLMVQLRDDIVDEVTRTYFERRRLQVEFLMDPPGNVSLLLKKRLRMQELTASLDGLTGSRFSEAITQNE